MPTQRQAVHISGDGVHCGLPGIVEVLLCATNSDPTSQLSVWVTMDVEVHPAGSVMEILWGTGAGNVPQSLTVASRDGRSVVQATTVLVLPRGRRGGVIYK